ncbi:MAG: hypothetical protein KAS76_02660 [Thermoplasmatales archaeon]|nr:hypothetical protein [Thermoplasmatales archaeon]
MKVKGVEETVEDYVISTVAGAYRNKRHWMKQRFDEDSSIKKALSWAYGQIDSGVGEVFTWEDAENGFREISEIANVFADYCKHSRRQS